MTTLADQVRAWLDAHAAFRKAASDKGAAEREVPEAMRSPDMAEAYLRGYDDAKAESAEAIAVLREEGKRLTARVRELEANNRDLLSTKVIVCDDHEVHEQSAAVGVVGAVRWGIEVSPDNVRFCDSRKEAEQYVATWSPVSSVVAIVDPAQIVPLASATPVRWLGEFPGFKYIRNTQEEIASIGVDTVTPLYPGLAQNVQEGE